MNKYFLIALVSSTILNSAYAGDTNGCAQLHLQITNLTNTACVLTNHAVIHGNLMTSPPMSILPYDSKRFDMMQTGFGPSITLSYQCGNEIISFNSQQNACVLKSGKITGIVLSPAPVHIAASYEALEGSYFWDKPGSINWKIVGTA